MEITMEYDIAFRLKGSGLSESEMIREVASTIDGGCFDLDGDITVKVTGGIPLRVGSLFLFHPRGADRMMLAFGNDQWLIVQISDNDDEMGVIQFGPEGNLDDLLNVIMESDMTLILGGKGTLIDGHIWMGNVTPARVQRKKVVKKKVARKKRARRA